MIQTLLLNELDNFIKDAVYYKPKSSYNLKMNFSNYNLKKEKDNIVFKSEAMGLQKSDIEMSIKNRHLIVKSKKNDKDSFTSNIDCNVFVGDDVSLPDATATLDQGILTIVIPTKINDKVTSINFS